MLCVNHTNCFAFISVVDVSEMDSSTQTSSNLADTLTQTK